MKKIKHILMFLVFSIALAACDNSLARATRTVGLMQEDMTKLVNELREIQLLENNLQSNFEETLKRSDDLSAFMSKDSAVEQNIQTRNKHLSTLEETIKSLTELANELVELNKKDTLPADQFQSLQVDVQNLNTHLNVYIEDYKKGLEQESISFKSIANPDSDYIVFFGTMRNVNLISTTNRMNLDKVLPSFEPLNTRLINLKVYLVNMGDKQ